MTAEAVGYKAKAFEPRNLAYFFLIVFGLMALADWLEISGIVQVSGEGLSNLSAGPGIMIIVLANWGPLIAAFVVTAITEGKSGVKALWRRFWNRNMSIKWLLVAVLMIPAMGLVANLVSRTLDGQAYPFFFSYNPPWTIISVFITAFIFNGILEEFGWRGYVLPRFQVSWNALTSSIILGAIWASWHIGEWFIPGSHLYQRNFWLWALGMILLSILMTWVFNNTKGSVLSAVLIHAMANTGIIWALMDWRYYGIELLAVILIVIIFGSRNLAKQRFEEET
jgi:membrane protease YdiL (CAAX protease family)